MITITLIPGVVSKAGAASGSVPQDTATATVGAVLYTTRSANGASCKLARMLVEAGCPDQPWETRTPDGQRCLHGSSIHSLARLTVASEPRPRFVKWAPRPDIEPEAAAQRHLEAA